MIAGDQFAVLATQRLQVALCGVQVVLTPLTSVRLPLRHQR